MMKKPDYISEWEYKGNKLEFTIFFVDSFEKVRWANQSYAFALDTDNKLLIVSNDGETWNIPGGGIEAGETFVDTTKRELIEEANVIIDTNKMQPFFYQISQYAETGIIEGVHLRYITHILEKRPFVSDPGGETKFQKYIDISEIEKYIKWDGFEKVLKEKLQEYLKNN